MFSDHADHAFWKHCPSDSLFYLSIPPEFHGGDTPLIYVQPWALYAVITASSFARPVSIPTHTASCKQCLYPMYNTDSVSVCVCVCNVHVCAYMCRCFRYWQHGHGNARHAIVNYVINPVGVEEKKHIYCTINKDKYSIYFSVILLGPWIKYMQFDIKVYGKEPIKIKYCRRKRKVFKIAPKNRKSEILHDTMVDIFFLFD